MNNLNNDNLNIVELPDEILFIIFKKLNTIDVFHSLVGVNQQFDRLALDPLNVRDLDMTDIMIIKSLYDKTPSIDTETLSKICSKILPRIHRQVHKLTVEQYSTKDILLAANYSELYSLSLINFQAKILYKYLRDDLILRDLLTKQITHLNIDIKRTTKRFSLTVSKIFELIVSLCKNLTVLNFCDMFHTRTYETSVFYRSSNYMSSTLIKLKINVPSLDHCLYLLDGRLDSLSTLIINVEYILDREKLPKLKYLSFTISNDTWQYDNLIVPLLCRMINLEELKLFLLIKRHNSIYVDGIQLYNQFLIYMTQLKKFTFCINTEVYNEVTVELPSNEDIQRSFIGRGYQQVTSYLHTSSKITSQCLIYSLPYDFEYFLKIDKSFQGVLANAGDDSIKNANFDENKAKELLLHLYTFIEWVQDVLLINPVDIKQKFNLLNPSEKSSDVVSSGMNCIKNILHQFSSSLEHTHEEFIDQQKLYYRTDNNYIYDDYVFESEINYAIQLTQQNYEKMLYKQVLTDGFFEIIRVRNRYCQLCFESQKKIHFDLIKRYIEVQVILLAPICAHICEYVYQLLHPTTSIMNANWPPLVTIRNYDLPGGGYNITYSSISTSALSTCHFYLIPGILNDKNFGYLLHSSKDFQSSSHTPKTTTLSLLIMALTM
ncbi:unnamed protein product [Rotaria sordida]|uniref:F-box domain-containing protein n=1 Tax=Rotaria sordida TaxID=392033 RepID=A0A815GGT6_9BILA|nr:unnamed protein product [Rotaria sordida]